MSEHWTNRLSEYLDGNLGGAARAECEAHLVECPECAAVLEDLRGVVDRAATLQDVPPSRDLWPDIESRLPARRSEDAPDGSVVPLEAHREGASARAAARRADGHLRVPRRITLTVPQLVAAGIALVTLSTSAVWLALPASPPATGAAVIAAEAPPATATAGSDAAPTPVLFTAAYDAAVRELEAEFEGRRGELDPQTIRVVEENLAIIDAAIAEANRALVEDPSSAFLNTHLANTMRQKVDLLRQAATIERTET